MLHYDLTFTLQTERCYIHIPIVGLAAFIGESMAIGEPCNASNHNASKEADKLLGDPLSCHVCTVPDTYYLTPEVTFPVKTAPSVLKKVVDAAGGKFLPQPRLLIGRSPEGHRIWLGTHDQYRDARRSAGGVHLVYNPLYEIIHMDINQSVRSALHMLLHALNAITCITCITSHYISLHIVTDIT